HGPHLSFLQLFCDFVFLPVCLALLLCLLSCSRCVTFSCLCFPDVIMLIAQPHLCVCVCVCVSVCVCV
ncbi:hypothetical protein AAFF_G00289540, partial [Aldrovandia affinis]